jgi:hypothetical protein
MEIIDERFLKKRISQERLFTHYFGNWSLYDMYKNPFRIDNSPTCNFFYHRNGTLFFKDPAWTDSYPSKGCFSIYIYVQFMFNLSTNYDACYKIAHDFDLVGDNKDVKRLESMRDILESKPVVQDKPSFSSIKVKTKNFTSAALKFWSLPDYVMKEEVMVRLNAYMISDAWINNKLMYQNQTFAFGYYLDKPDIFQLYFPNAQSRDKRFRCNQVSRLYCKQFLRNESYVIVTKSYKDFIYLYLSGFNVCCVLSENYKMSDEEIAFLISKIKGDMTDEEKRKRIFLFYDYDKTGIDFAKVRSEEYGCNSIFTEDIMNKDYSDMAHNIGLKQSKQVIKLQLMNYGVDI